MQTTRRLIRGWAFSFILLSTSSLSGCLTLPAELDASPSPGLSPLPTNTPAPTPTLTPAGSPTPTSTPGPTPSYSYTYYVSPSGNDSSGDGSLSRPWKTLFKATTSARQAGTLIRIQAGTYLETQTSALAPGVSLEGDGAQSTIIQSTVNGLWSPIIYAGNNPEGTNGNQSISKLKFDGRNLTTQVGVVFEARSNVSIHDCVFVDFLRNAATFTGITNWLGANAPKIYATGNSFYNNTVTNSSVYIKTEGYGSGCVQFGGQIGFKFYNNTVTQLTRGNGAKEIGWPLKMANEGYIKDCKIYNNTLTKEPWTGNMGQDDGWNFVSEFWNYQGLEMYGNTLQGTVDLAWGSKGVYNYALWFHDNIVQQPTLNTHYENGLFLEIGHTDVLVENNIFRNLTVGYSNTVHDFTLDGAGLQVHRVTVRNNLFDNIGGGNGQGQAVKFYTGGETYGYITDISIYNNTAFAAPSSPGFIGIEVPSVPGNKTSNIRIENNVVIGFSFAGIFGGAGSNIDQLSIQNNDLYNNATNILFWNGTPTNYVNSNNLSVDPQFMSSTNYHLKATSPLIDKGRNVGLPFKGLAPDVGAYEDF